MVTMYSRMTNQIHAAVVLANRNRAQRGSRNSSGLVGDPERSFMVGLPRLDASDAARLRLRGPVASEPCALGFHPLVVIEAVAARNGSHGRSSIAGTRGRGVPDLPDARLPVRRPARLYPVRRVPRRGQSIAAHRAIS